MTLKNQAPDWRLASDQILQIMIWTVPKSKIAHNMDCIGGSYFVSMLKNEVIAALYFFTRMLKHPV